MKRVFPVLLPYAVFALLAAISWNRWIQPYVDSGRELMIPWRVSRGEALYRELHFHHGPLAPWAGALIDRAAGRSLATRTAFAALLALLELEALRRLAAKFLPPVRAGIASALTVGLAFFLKPGGWLFPFSFDTSIAVAALTWAALLVSNPTPRSDLWTAVCLLAALLSRVELGLVGAASVAFEARARPRRLLLLTLAPIAGATAGYLAVSAGIPLTKLISDGWLAILRPPAAFQNVYRAYAGLDRPGLRLAELTLAAVLCLLIGALLTASAAISRAAARRAPLAGLPEGFAIVILAAAALLHLRPPSGLAETIPLVPPLVRVVPIAVISIALSRVLRVIGRRAPGPWSDGIPDAALLVGAACSARLLLAAGYAGPYNAFFLPLPVVIAVAVVWRIAGAAAPATGESLPRLVTSSLVVLLVFRILVLSDTYRGPGWAPLATAAGTVVLPEPLAFTTRETLEELTRRGSETSNLSGFPEAGFLNYVLGRANPLPLEQFFPGHLDPGGEVRVIEELERTPPDAVVLINALAVGEGARSFGKDYSAALDAAIRRDFVAEAVFGPGAREGARIGDPDFFIEVRVPARPRR